MDARVTWEGARTAGLAALRRIQIPQAHAVEATAAGRSALHY